MMFILLKTGSHAVEEISGNQVRRSLSSPAVHTVAVSPIVLIVCVSSSQIDNGVMRYVKVKDRVLVV